MILHTPDVGNFAGYAVELAGRTTFGGSSERIIRVEN
jgi:hypothetical protein